MTCGQTFLNSPTLRIKYKDLSNNKPEKESKTEGETLQTTDSLKMACANVIKYLILDDITIETCKGYIHHVKVILQQAI